MLVETHWTLLSITPLHECQYINCKNTENPTVPVGSRYVSCVHIGSL